LKKNWAVFSKITEELKFWATFWVYFDPKTAWAIFWAIFSPTHLVTLSATRFLLPRDCE
jgi:hypothetical protein